MLAALCALQTAFAQSPQNLKLGSNNTAAFEVIDWSAGPYFIKTEIDDDGDAVYTELGTSQMLSVPYALHSLTANKTLGDSLWKKSGSHIYYSEGRIGLGTSKPEGDIHIADTVGTTDTYTYYETDNVKSRVGADEASGAMWLQSGSEWDRGSITDINFSGIFGQPRQMIIKANGNVGIGTMAPERRLHVDDGSDVNGSYGGYIQTGPGTSYNVGFDNNEIQARNNGNPSHLMLQAEGGDLNIHTGLSDPYRRFIIKDDGKVGMGTSEPVSRLDLRAPSAWSDETPLFEIKNNDGVPVFAVYNNGVRILVEDDPAKKGPKGGFAIGGFDPTKSGSTVDFMRITPDSIRFNINNEASTKGPKGGFAIGGFDRTKGVVNEDFMYITPQSSEAGSYNSFIGYRAGYINTGNYNSFMGYYAGYNNTSGSFNTFLGYQAGFSNQTGSNNVLIGYKAGYKGDQNVFIGNNTGRSNTTGSSNVAIGYQSGFNNSTGSNNVFIGNQCGWYNTSGSNNTFIGWKTGLHNEDGTRNVFLGESAGSANRSGSNNVFLGFEAGRSNLTGNSNVFIGRRTGLFTNEGSNNVFIGLEAGLSNTSGIDNSIIGHQAGFYNTTGHDNVFFGYKAGLHNTTAKDNVFIGSGAGSANRDGIGNVYVGFEAGRSNLHGDYNVFIGRYAGLNELGDQKLYIDNYWTSSPLLYGDFSANLLRVNGNLQYTGSLSHYSDIRMKNNITDIENVLDKINDFRGVYFDWDDEAKENHVVNDSRQIGIIAQEVEKVFPELVSENDEGYKLVDYVKLTPILLQAIKEQQQQIDNQQMEIDQLIQKNNEIEDLKLQLLRMEQMVMEMAGKE